MRRGLGYVLAGMALAAAWLTSWQPDWLRSAWAAGPNMLYSTPGLTDAAWVAGSPGLPMQCVFDNTPVTVGDGDRQVIRCATGTGVVAVGTLAGAPLLIDLVAWNGVAPTAAAALADGAANPTAPHVGAYGLVWNGATWDRLTGTTANGVDTDVTRSVLPTGAATEATLATLATEVTAAAILADTATIDAQTLAIQTAVETLDNIVAGNEAQVDVVTSALPAGAATEATLATRVAAAQVPAALGQTTAANSLPVVLPNDVVHEVQGDQVSPSTQTTVACDDTGAVTLAFQAGTMRAEIWNTSASDVCLRWGTAGAPDRTSLISCSLVLGAHGGSGTSEIYVTPEGFRVGGEAFECDTAAAPTGDLVVVEWIAQ